MLLTRCVGGNPLPVEHPRVLTLSHQHSYSVQAWLCVCVYTIPVILPLPLLPLASTIQTTEAFSAPSQPLPWQDFCVCSFLFPPLLITLIQHSVIFSDTFSTPHGPAASRSRPSEPQTSGLVSGRGVKSSGGGGG